MKMENLFVNTSISDQNNFKNICKSSSENEELFNNFKNNQNFTEILEHTTYEQGLGYISEIKKNQKINLSLINKFKQNDEQGNPLTFEFEEPFGNMSPSTIRYMKVLNDLIDMFGSLDNMKIVEIGVGYGGQCKIIQDHFNVSEYCLVDLPETLSLTKKYLSKYNFENLNFLDFTNLVDSKYDLVISNYAITECSQEIQDLYIEKIINKSKHGYITGNDIGGFFNIKNYTKNDWLSKIPNSMITDETPLTHDKNYLLYF
jgi:putative sugar O-methyltransferase